MKSPSAGESISSVIPIVKDDVPIREIIRKVLESQRHTIHAASNGDLVILDVMMPKLDGWETLRRLRQVFSGCARAVRMLTVFLSTDDIIKGLELGADDYRAKPFGFRELTARVNAVQRRAGPSECNVS